MERLRKYKFNKLNSGNADGVEDFFNKIIKPQFSNITAIKELHNSLMNYVDIDGAIFFLRFYGSFPKDSYNLLRRGFLTEFPDKSKIVFCDNTFSMIFTGLKIAGFSMNENELYKFLSQDKLICGFGQTTSEKEKSFYTPKNAIRVDLNSKGWYQAHIKPTGYGYDLIAPKTLQSYFPNPERNDWNESKIRNVTQNLSDLQKKLLKAHFIRLVHPLNSFLVPKKNHVIYDGKRLGEEAELIHYVRNYLERQFPKEYKEFENLTLPCIISTVNPKIKSITWYEEPMINSKKTADNPKNIDKMKVSKKLINTIDLNSDLVEENSIIKLDNWLKSIGKKAFVEILVPSFIENPNVSLEEICKEHELFSSYTKNSQKSRFSSAKSIFAKGLEIEALNIIIESSKVNSEIVEKAKFYLESLS